MNITGSCNIHKSFKKMISKENTNSKDFLMYNIMLVYDEKYKNTIFKNT